MNIHPQITSSRAKDEYQQWVKAHKIMKDSPPAAGWDYLTHANNLLSLLQGIADIHPVVKVVITGFKTVVMFEKDRRDNDVRVTAVFLAQTDTMQVLLDIDDLARRQENRLDLQSLRSNAMLGNVLERIAKDIKECGNSIDTYYKESRFSKFWKSQEWKERMLGYVQTFSDHRIHLQQIVSLQVASGVGDLVSKMNDVLSLLYKPKSGWEKELDDRTHRLGNPTQWLDDQSTLRSMVALTDDPTLPIPPLGQENPSDFLVKSRLEEVRLELGMSLDVICERNMDRFELRLNFFAYQMQEAIHESTHTIVQALSGPFDRLENEDLRELWKEMDWIFCIDNKLFASALFEYYLDRFSRRKENESGVQPSVSSKSRSKFGSIHHVDSWTLEYLANYGESITAAIDTDESGFIRISEANAFTRRIPDGWNLPRFCAYSAAGWSLEARIYRKRINYLLSKMVELQASVASIHLQNVFSCLRFPLLLNVCHAFWREPKASLNRPPISLELKNLVKEKIINQDTALRKNLDSLKWTIDDPSTIDLLFGDAPLESYILQICSIMLESFLVIVHSSCEPTPLDMGGLNRVVTAFDIMRQISVKRVEYLKATFEESNTKENFAEYINQYRGGIWSYFNANADYKLPTYVAFLDEYSKDSYSFEEFKDFTSDVSILDDFPLPVLSEVTSRSFKETRITIPEEQMKDFNTPMLMDEYIYGFPPCGWSCNLCNATPIAEQRYHCIECFDLDLCEKCFNLPEDKCVVEDHRFHHPMISLALDFLGHQYRILEEEATYHLEGFQYFLRSRERSNADNAKKSSTEDKDNKDEPNAANQPLVPDILFMCGRCSDGISADSLFFKCVAHACKEYYLCAKCGASKEDVEGSQHKWWHTVVTLRRDIIEHEVQRRKTLDSTSGPTNNTNECTAQEKGPNELLHDSVVSAISNVEEKMANLESNMKANNTALDERMTRLEAKMDNLILELQGWFSNGRQP